MNDHQLRSYMYALSYLAQIEAAKIENKVREMRDESPAYGEDWFNGIAMQLEELGRNL
jgi:hypothetical protein